MLRKEYWGKECGQEVILPVVHTGNGTDEMIKSYIDNHIEGDDTFHIEE